jgi:hypothetical protein
MPSISWFAVGCGSYASPSVKVGYRRRDGTAAADAAGARRRLAWRENELDVGSAARLELELLADGGLNALMTRAAVVGAQHLHDAVTEIAARGGPETRLASR